MFHDTLRELQNYLGIQEKVPKVGGAPLDLHVLYQAVTGFGGCERVISRKQWRVSRGVMGWWLRGIGKHGGGG